MRLMFQTHGTPQVPGVVIVMEYDAGASPSGATVRVNLDPDNAPEKCAGGAGFADAGPTSTR